MERALLVGLQEAGETRLAIDLPGGEAMANTGSDYLSRFRSAAQREPASHGRFAAPGRGTPPPEAPPRDQGPPPSRRRVVFEVAGLAMMVVLYAIALYVSVRMAGSPQPIDPLVPGWPWW